MNKIIDFVIDSINASRERLKMSIVTFYIVILAIYHWRVFTILFFGDIPTMEKISVIDIIYKDWQWYHYLSNILLTLVISVFFMILFPTIMWLAEKILVSVSIKRKENKELEENADREKEKASVRHQFELKQEGTGNLKETGYLEKIKTLEELNLQHIEEKKVLSKEIDSEREKQRNAITNLKNGFDKVEQSYKEQIKELSRQLNLISESTVSDKGSLAALLSLNSIFYNTLSNVEINKIIVSFSRLNASEQSFFKKIISHIINFPSINDNISFTIDRKEMYLANSRISSGRLYSMLDDLLIKGLISDLSDDRNELTVKINMGNIRESKRNTEGN